MSMVQWWHNSNRGKLKYSEQNLSQHHSVTAYRIWTSVKVKVNFALGQALKIQRGGGRGIAILFLQPRR
jgi:hypothetical protein